MAHHFQHDSDEPIAPLGLGDALRDAYERGPAVPAEIDAAILDQAQRHFAAGARFRRVTGLGAGLAAAAGLGLVVWVSARGWGVQGRSGVPQPPAVALAVSRDIDGDGRVDIVDALRLAASIEGRQASRSEWDVNGDGRVDRGDVDSVAATAVKLDGGAM
jgi:hypothetical protein